MILCTQEVRHTELWPHHFLWMYFWKYLDSQGLFEREIDLDFCPILSKWKISQLAKPITGVLNYEYLLVFFVNYLSFSTNAIDYINVMIELCFSVEASLKWHLIQFLFFFFYFSFPCTELLYHGKYSDSAFMRFIRLALAWKQWLWNQQLI